MKYINLKGKSYKNDCQNIVSKGDIMNKTYKPALLAILFVMVFCYAVKTNAATIQFPSTPENAANSTLTYFYLNVTSNEDLNQSLITWSNSTGSFNFSLTNTSLTHAYVNLTTSNTSLLETNYTYSVWSQNTTGNWNVSDSRAITFDRTAPSFINTTINNTSPTNQSTNTITCNYADFSVRYANLSFEYSNGTLIDFSLMTNYPDENKSNLSYTFSTTEIEFIINITLTDWAGNSQTNTTLIQSNGTIADTFVIDSRAPVLANYSPSVYTSDQNVTLTVDVLDRFLNSSTISFYFNNSEVTPDSSVTITHGKRLTYFVTNLDDDTIYFVNVSANDTWGKELNLSSGYWSFHVDASAPTAATNFIINHTADQTPTSNDTYNRNNLTLNWTAATDSETYISQYVLLARNRSLSQQTGSFGSWTSWYNLNSSILNTSTNYLVENLIDDYQYEFNLTAYDAANNTAKTGTLNATIDLSAPELSRYVNGTEIKYPTHWTNYTNLTIWLNITDVSGINNNSINVTFNGTYPSFNIWPQSQNQTLYQINFSVTNLENNNNYSVVLYANDTLNQNTTISYNISTDFDAPTSISVANLTAPYSGAGGWYNNSVVWVVTCSDAISGASVYTVNETSYSNDWTNSSNFTIDTNGNYTYLFQCKDQAGNINSTLQVIPVDNSAPVIDYNSRSPRGSGVAVTNAVLKINFSDGESGIDTSSCIMSWRRASQSTYTTLSYDDCSSVGVIYIRSLDEGTTYYMNITVYDKVGHSDNEVWSFLTTTGSTTTDGSSSSSSSTTNETTTTDTYSLAWQNLPTAINVFQGNSTSFEIQLKNTGNQNIANTTISLTGILLNTIDPSKISIISSGATRLIKITLNTTKNDSVGVYDYTLKAQGSEATATATLKVKIQPAINDSTQYVKTIADCIIEYGKVKELLEKANKTVENQTSLEGIVVLLSEVESLIQQANNSLNSEDYAQVVQLQKEINNRLTTAKATLETIIGNKKVSIWIYIVIPIIILLIVAFVLYFSLVPEDKRLIKKLGVSLPKIKMLKIKKKEKQINEPIPSRIKKLRKSLNKEKNEEKEVKKEYNFLADKKMSTLKEEIQEEKRLEKEQEKSLRKLKGEQVRQKLGQKFSKLKLHLKKDK